LIQAKPLLELLGVFRLFRCCWALRLHLWLDCACGIHDVIVMMKGQADKAGCEISRLWFGKNYSETWGIACPTTAAIPLPADYN